MKQQIYFSNYVEADISFTPSERLILAVIRLAQKDALGNGGRRHQHDALCYFQSDLYRSHLQGLGLDDSLLPVGIGELPAVTMA
jgi:hypothetical protein